MPALMSLTIALLSVASFEFVKFGKLGFALFTKTMLELFKFVLVAPSICSILLFCFASFCTDMSAVYSSIADHPAYASFAWPTIMTALYYVKTVVVQNLVTELRLLFVYQVGCPTYDSMFGTVYNKVTKMVPSQNAYEIVTSHGYGLLVQEEGPVYTNEQRSACQVVFYKRVPLIVWTGLGKDDGRYNIATLSFFASKIKEFISDAEKEARQESKPNVVGLYRYVLKDSTWRKTSTRTARSLEYLALSKEAESVLKDAKKFVKSQKWYAQRSVPYRRGYLLAGLEGSGKTTLIDAVAAECKLDICLVQLAGMSDTEMQSMILSAPDAILAFEDIDAMTTSVETKSSLACLLNVIDGLDAQKGRMVFFTTNHYDRLSPEFLRPGRCDVKASFGPATRDQIVKLYDIFYTFEQDPEADDSQPVLNSISQDYAAETKMQETLHQETLQQETLSKEASLNAHRFADLVENHGLAVAAFQTHFTKHDAESAIASWQDMLKAFETTL